MAESSSSKQVGFLSPTEFKVERVFPIRNLVSAGPTEPPPAQKEEDFLSSASSTEGPSLAAGVEDHLSLVEKLAVNIKSNIENRDPAFLPPPWPKVPPKSSLRSLPESQLGRGSREDRQTTERARLVPTTSGPPGISPGLIVQSPFHFSWIYFHSSGAVSSYSSSFYHFLTKKS
jgi:hypothetical protein